MIYFWSDLHFFHKNILKYSQRPNSDLADIHESIISNLNSTVQATDTVYHLGDFAFANKNKAAQVLDILQHLKGNIVLVQGNHDDAELWAQLIKQAPDMCAQHPSATHKVQLVFAPYLELSLRLAGG